MSIKEFAQDILRRNEDYDNILINLSYEPIRVWDNYDTVLIPWAEVPEDLKYPLLDACDSDGVIKVWEVA